RAPAEPASAAALRTRVAELEAELARRDQAREGVARPVDATTPEPKGEAPASKAGPLSVEQIRALLKTGKGEDVARAFREIEAMTDRAQKLALLREMVAAGYGSRAVSSLKKMGGPEAVALILEILQ